MNTSIRNPKTLAATAAAMLWLAACVAPHARPDGAVAVRDKLTQLQADPQLATRAPLAIKEAETAVIAAEVPRERDEAELSRHLVLMADRKVDIAWAQAHARLSEDQRKALAEQREMVRLDSRTREADNARSDAAAARVDASDARSEARAARSDTDFARMDAASAKQQAEDLKRQLAEINAKSTDRGLVVTLGDVLFASGTAVLAGGAPGNLGKLANFLNRYPDRTVMIEGHTDSRGNPDSNVALSQRRADAVRSYLTSQGISSARLTTAGKGADAPVADNASASGRQQNRRVEVIISNTDTP